MVSTWKPGNKPICGGGARICFGRISRISKFNRRNVWPHEEAARNGRDDWGGSVNKRRAASGDGDCRDPLDETGLLDAGWRVSDEPQF